MSNILRETLNKQPLICAEGYLFAMERRGYLSAGGFVPEVVLEHPEVVTQLHREFIRAGSDVVQAFTYYGHREKLRIIGKEHLLESLQKNALQIAKDAASGKNIAVAGSVSTYGYFLKDGVENMLPSFNEHLKILSNSGVDLIILEAMSSQYDIIETLLKCSKNINLPIWLSISCVFDKNKEIYLGYDDDVKNDKPQIYENFKESLLKRFIAGAIFVGENNTAVLGDYAAGPSHVIPTNSAARFSSPVSIEDFLVRTSVTEIKSIKNKAKYNELLDNSIFLAELEGLHGHAYALKLRRK